VSGSPEIAIKELPMPDLDQIKQADRKRETGGADWTIGFRHFNQPKSRTK
jgi:hypothetical protein